MSEAIAEIAERLDRIEAVLQSLVQERAIKDWYSTTEVAQLLDKSPYSVREWARLGRIHASKKPYARGAHPEWLISHDELTRIRNQGLLPLPSFQRNH